jgi:hypothetical protein
MGFPRRTAVVTCLLIFSSFFSFFFYLVSSIHSPYRLVFDNNSLQACGTRRPTRPNHIHSRSHCLALALSLFHSFTPLVDLALSDNTKLLPRGNRALSLLSLFSLPFVYLHLLCSLPITDAPEFAATIQKLDTAERQRAPRMYIRPPSCSSRRASHHRIARSRQSSLFPLFLSIFTHLGAFSSFSATARWTCCPHGLRRSRARAYSQPTPLRLFIIFSLHLPWTTLSPSQRIALLSYNWEKSAPSV